MNINVNIIEYCYSSSKELNERDRLPGWILSNICIWPNRLTTEEEYNQLNLINRSIEDMLLSNSNETSISTAKE